MGLADDIKKQVAEEERSRERSGVEVRTLDQAVGDRAMKLQVFGEPKVGKTSFCLSVIEYLRSEKGLGPDDVMVVIFDNDDGVLPLLRQGLVPEEYYPNIHYALNNSFEDLLEATDKFIPELQAHQKEHGNDSAWLIVDNMQSAWEWTRDKFSLDVYGMRENELARRKRIEARQKGKRTLPTFDQMADYGVINPMHNNWADHLKLSGVNFIWTAPEKDAYDATGQKTGDVRPGGQKDNPYRVDHILYLYTDEGNHLADLVGSRFAKKKFKRMPNPTYSKFLTFLDKVSE